MSDFLLFTVGFIVALFTVWKLSKEKLYSERVVFDAVILISLLTLVCSRVFYVLFHFEQFGFNILKWIVVGLYPGMSIGGALIGAGLALWFLSDKKTVVPFPELVDVLTRTFLYVAPLLLVGMLFFSPELGNVWGITIPVLNKQIATHSITGYRLLSILILLGVMGFFFRRKLTLASGTYSAVVWLLFIVSYFLIDFMKANDVYYWKLSVDQWIYSILILIIAIILFFQVKQKAFLKPKK